MKSLKGELLGKTHCLSVLLMLLRYQYSTVPLDDKRPMIGPSVETKTGGNVGLPGLAGGLDLAFGFP